VDNSLKMLNTDHLDLLLIHRPDPLLNPSEVAEAFGILKASGKVLHFGVSNFTIHQFEMLQSYLPFPLVTNQIEISLACLQPLFDGTLDVLMKHRVSPMAWSPLGGGQLMTTDHQNVFSSLKERQGSDAQLALSWLLQHPSKIFPVIGTTKPERIIEAAAAVNIQFDRQTWFQVLKQVTGRDVP
jgi:predicted oxidoreductase